MRGGDSADGEPTIKLWGLSPHARGRRRKGQGNPYRHGPIPACAGETSSTSRTSIAWRAYPRMRGGDMRYVVRAKSSSGLSPHARGRHFAVVQSDALAGPISACAGETLSCRCRCSGRGAYPRMRGGDDEDGDQIGGVVGLSPHARGRRRKRHRFRAAHGPIPACAGETDLDDGTPPASRAYPRMRGGDLTTSRPAPR